MSPSRTPRTRADAPARRDPTTGPAAGGSAPVAELRGVLEGVDADALEGVRVEVDYQVRTDVPAIALDPKGFAGTALRPQGRTVTRTVRQSVPVQADGSFVVVPQGPVDAATPISYTAYAANGALLKHLTELASQAVHVPVAATAVLKSVALDKRTEVQLTRSDLVVGRVVDTHGAHVPAGLQVLVSIRRTDGQADEWHPVIVTHTDSDGAFAARAQLDDASAAQVRVGATAPRPLTLTDGKLPEPLIIEVDVSSAMPDDDCGCDPGVSRTPQESMLTSSSAYSTDLGTGCARLNVPDRTLEEFDFYQVVRTTEPSVRAVTHSGKATVKDDSMYTVATWQALVEELETLVVKQDGERVVMDARGRDYLRRHLMNLGLMEALDRIDDAEDLDWYSAYWIVAESRAELERTRPPARPKSRVAVSAASSVDWDHIPTFYEATSAAHGHILHFKQTWQADGYSLGDLLYSLPLAPGQKRLVSIVDWERRDDAARRETTELTEGLTNVQSRDRDLGEVISGSMSEWMRGGSRSSSSGFGAGTGAAGNGSYQGFNFGALLGVSGGSSQASSEAWQDGARSLGASSLQTLRDATLQSASSVRGLRSTTVVASSQGEAVRGSTEVVANHNHCHAMTVQYFEVLRHLKVSNTLADVQECLFIPLPVTAFDRTKALRWRDPLTAYLRRPELAPAFNAAARVDSSWKHVPTPVARYADELVTWVAGEVAVTFVVSLPPLPEPPRTTTPEALAAHAAAVAAAAAPTEGVLGVLLAVATGGASLAVGAVTNAAVQSAQAMAQSLNAEPTALQRYERFHQEVMPGVAAGLVDQMELWAVTPTGEVHLQGADFTLVSDYRAGTPLIVSVRGILQTPISRADITHVVLRSRRPLPLGCRIILNRATIDYQAGDIQHALVRDSRVDDDIEIGSIATDTPSWRDTITMFGGSAGTLVTRGAGATIHTPTDEWERREPRVEDLRMTDELLAHLNQHLEHYHQALWWTMDPNRRFALLDGFEAPSSGGRSLASVVENRVVGVVGNSLVMPVARGVHLDPVFSTSDDAVPELLASYRPTTPLKPFRVSLPTRGVFAEAMLGSCNSCEEKDDTRHWDWDVAKADEPQPLPFEALTSRREDLPGLAPTPFPASVVNVASPLPAPDPSSITGALQILASAGFRDVTGLAKTQDNAAAAFKQALDTAASFGQEASKLAQQAAMLKSLDQTMSSVTKAETAGQITPEKAQELRSAALDRLVGGGTGDAAAAIDLVKKVQHEGLIGADDARDLSRSILERSNGVPPDTEREVAAGLASRLDPAQIDRIEMADDRTVIQTTNGADMNAGSSGIVRVGAGSADARTIAAWAPLITFRPPPSLVTSLAARDITIPPLSSAWGALNLDYYPVRISKMPTIDGQQMDAAGFLEHVRLHFNKLLDTRNSHFLPLDNAIDKPVWESADPVGAVIDINVKVIPLAVLPQWEPYVDHSLVVCTRHDEQHWVFSAAQGSWSDGAGHPVTGNRMWAIKPIGDEFVFYTMGADRATGPVDWAANALDLVWYGADELWKSLQRGIESFVTVHKGKAYIPGSDSNRYRWDAVRKAVNPSDET